MIYLAIFYVLFLGWRLWALTLNLFSTLFLPKASFCATTRLSVLIPARNEENNLLTLIPELQKQTFQNFEILIYDDSSTDNTWKVIQQLSLRYSNLKGIKGIDLPLGWLGKNHACYQLAKQAKGDYLLFFDADVKPYPELMEQALDYCQKHSLKLLSIFPVQETLSFGERITIPIMQQVLLTLLPMRFIRSTHKPSFAAANGQFMLFEAKTYQRLQPHAWVKNHPVEDILITRLFKKFHIPVATILGKGAIACRMYTGYSDAVAGFSKNLLHFFGNSSGFLLFYNLVVLLGWITLFWFPMPFVISGICLIIFMHVGWVYLSGAGWKQLFLIPFQTLALLHISFAALKSKYKKNIQWKDRSINLP